MKKKYILAVAALSIGIYFAFPQSVSDSMVAEAATAACPKPVTVDLPEPEPVEPVEDTVAEPEEDEGGLYREGLAAYIISVNETVSKEEADEMVSCMMDQAEKHQMDEKLIMAVAQTESTYYSEAVSCTDYKGLMQTGDILAEEAGYTPEDLFDPEISIEVGADYIDTQMETFEDDVILALTAYNQGPGAVYDGDYSTGYAVQTIENVENIEIFLQNKGFLQ